MDVVGLEWFARGLDFFSWIIGLGWAALVIFWRRLVSIQAEYPQLLSMQTLFGLLGTGVGVWKWWEGREGNLFRRFESMIQRQEARLVRACSDLLDIMNRPGPGAVIRAPLFVEKTLRLVLTRRKWHSASLRPVAQATDRRLEAALRTCDRKVTAHLDRLGLFRCPTSAPVRQIWRLE